MIISGSLLDFTIEDPGVAVTPTYIAAGSIFLKHANVGKVVPLAGMPMPTMAMKML